VQQDAPVAATSRGAAYGEQLGDLAGHACEHLVFAPLATKLGVYRRDRRAALHASGSPAISTPTRAALDPNYWGHGLREERACPP
jgi:hypothetical protein